MIELFGSAFVTFLVIIDPPGCAPIFASLTRGTSPAHRRTMAVRSAGIAWAILMLFALLGRPLLHALGISLASFRIAGGIMLFFIALDMVFERRTQRREERAHSIEGTPHAEDISVFPMAMPMISGPGSIASAMLWVSRAEGWLNVAVVLAAMTVVVLITLGTLLPLHCGFCTLANAKFFMGKLPQVTPPKVMALFVPETLIYQSPMSPGRERPNGTAFD